MKTKSKTSFKPADINDLPEREVADLEAKITPETEPEPAAVPVPEKKITLNMYCSHKRIPERRRAGMTAYTKVRRASMEEWDSIFANY